MAFNENSKFQDLIANPEAQAVLEKHLPGQLSEAQYNMIKNFSLKTIAGFPQANIKKETLEAIVADLAKIG